MLIFRWVIIFIFFFFCNYFEKNKKYDLSWRNNVILEKTKYLSVFVKCMILFWRLYRNFSPNFWNFLKSVFDISGMIELKSGYIIFVFRAIKWNKKCYIIKWDRKHKNDECFSIMCFVHSFFSSQNALLSKKEWNLGNSFSIYYFFHS